MPSRDQRQRGDDQPLPDYSVLDPRELPEGPDVLLDVPVVAVEEIDLEVDDLRAQVAVVAEVRDLVQISVGADVSLGGVQLKLEGVRAQAELRARLDNVTRVLARVLTSLDRNPELLASVGRAAEQVGRGGERLLAGAGEAVEDVGGGAGEAARDVGAGAGRAVGELGEGAGAATGAVGRGARQAVRDVAGGAVASAAGGSR